MNFKKYLIIGSTIFVLVLITNDASAQRVQHPVITQQKVQPESTLDYAKMQATYNRNLIKDYERAIGKTVISTADYEKMDEQKRKEKSTNKMLVVDNPLKAAQDYFTQKKGN